MNVEGVSGGCDHRTPQGQYWFVPSSYFFAEEQIAYRVSNKCHNGSLTLAIPASSFPLPLLLYPIRITTPWQSHTPLTWLGHTLSPPTHLAFSRLLLLVSELMVLLRVNRSSSGGKSLRVGEVVIGLRLAALAAIIEARSAGVLNRLDSCAVLMAWSMDWDWVLL